MSYFECLKVLLFLGAYTMTFVGVSSCRVTYLCSIPTSPRCLAELPDHYRLADGVMGGGPGEDQGRVEVGWCGRVALYLDKIQHAT